MFPGDFTMSKGHKHPLVLNNSNIWLLIILLLDYWWLLMAIGTYSIGDY
jgi:hypothetical protein